MKNNPTPANPDIDLKRLREMIEYRPESGRFTHLVARNSVAAGQECGWLERNGYARIRVGEHKVLAHRLAWLMMTGNWPTSAIDHVDGNRSNNVWSNLRLATPVENRRNSRLPRNNTSGCAGVHWRKHLSLWQATVRLHGQRVSLGHFIELKDAIAARKEAERRHFGEFRPVEVASGMEKAA